MADNPIRRLTIVGTHLREKTLALLPLGAISPSCCWRLRTRLLKPGRAFEVLATNTLAEGFMACPAVDGKAFYLRTKTHLYRVESLGSENK